MPELKNREVFHRDPVTNAIPNNGVATIGEPKSESDWAVLRYELESFVCDGEYRSGLERILSSFLTNTGQLEQQAVWISGFYGCGKSHLVRVLEYLWRDVKFPDGALARSLVSLPKDIEAHLIELSRLGRQEGGLWSAAGSLTGTGSVRLALLGLIFKGAKLPERHPAARLVIWLKQNRWYESVNENMEGRGRKLDNELRNMYVSPSLAQSLSEVIPEFPNDSTQVHGMLREQYPNVSDISDDELHTSIEEVLSLQSTTENKMPLTLLVLDEIQQFIGNDPERTLHVQSIVEACSKRFGSRLLFVGTGQSAMQANTELAKLQGRFSIQVTLSDVDVEKVVREVVLRKASDKVASVENVLDTYSGEIDRHLAGTKIGHQPADTLDRVADYPLLPVRRRLWERLLRVVDTAGTAGQLRTQLKIVHEATREVAEKPLGTVIPSDAIYRQIKEHMVTNGVMLRDVSTRIDQLNDGTEEGKLRYRLCSLIFMLGKLPQGGLLETGVKATADALADLLVEDVTAGSAPLRQQVPIVLQELVDDGRLILVDDEYRLQTPESEEWNTDYRARLSQILGNEVKISEVRSLALQNAVNSALKDLRLSQGTTRTPRHFNAHFGPDSPPENKNNVPVWIQDEWSTTPRSVLKEAQQEGIEKPTVFVFLPRLAADELKQAIAQVEATKETLSTKTTPATEGGIEARAAMNSRSQVEQRRLNDLVDDIVKNAKVYQGGGNEVVSESFSLSIKQAVETSLTRMFPRFTDADQQGWDTVTKRASEGGPDPLSALGYPGEVDKHKVCQEIWKFVGNNASKGSEVRRHFSGSPYGWPQDTVDGALLALLGGGFLKATHNGQNATAIAMNRPQIGVTDFAREGVTVSASQRIAVRKLGAALELPLQNGEEAEVVPIILQRILERANEAEGEPPIPQPPDRTLVTNLQGFSGNKQVVEVAGNVEELIKYYQDCSLAAEVIRERKPAWKQLEALLLHSSQLEEHVSLKSQMDAVRTGRNMLDNPSPLSPLLNQVTTALRKAVSEQRERLKAERDREVAELEASDDWSKIKPDDRKNILDSNELGPVPDINIGSDEELLRSLNDTTLNEWSNRILATRTRGSQAREQIAKLLSPEAVTIRIPRTTLGSKEEVESYVQELREQLLKQIAESPIIIA